MGHDILIRSTGKLIFHDKIQQSSINITRLRSSGGRSKRSADKIIVVGILEITQLGVLLSHGDYATRLHSKKQIWWENGERKRGRIKWQIFVKWGRGKWEANKVNCKETRFVIRSLVDVDDVSLAMAPAIPFDVCLNYVGISPKRKGWCSNST